MMSFGEKQKRFVDEYLIDLNATRAYQTVYEVKNKRSAQSSGSRLLTKVKETDYFKESIQRCHFLKYMEQNEVLESYAKIARREPYEEIYESYDFQDGEEALKTRTRQVKTPTIAESMRALEAINGYFKLVNQSGDSIASLPITFVDDVPSDDDD